MDYAFIISHSSHNNEKMYRHPIAYRSYSEVKKVAYQIVQVWKEIAESELNCVIAAHDESSYELSKADIAQPYLIDEERLDDNTIQINFHNIVRYKDCDTGNYRFVPNPDDHDGTHYCDGTVLIEKICVK